MRAFFVRPFGVKGGFDFERVQRELMDPALARLRAWGIDIEGGTTGEFIRQGNIREDMFRLLVTADLVVADVSIYNPNVFYEIGIAHTLGRDVILITQAESDIPFDLRHLRFLRYLNNREGRNELRKQLAKGLGDL